MPLTIVDCHVHVWEADSILYPGGEIMRLFPPAGPTAEALLQEMQGCGVSHTVLVQPSNYEFDHRYLASCLRRYPARFAGVARVNPLETGAPGRLEMWTRQHGLRGLRVAPFASLDGEWVLDRRIAPLWEKAAELGVPLCFQGGRGRLEAMAGMVGELSARFPELRIAFDHMGHPQFEKGLDDAGLQAFLALSRRENILVKMSGQYALSHESYPYRDTWPVMRAIYDHFGPRRMMWGSDFPYVMAREGYAKALALVRDELDYLSDEDRAWILGKTALSLWSFGAQG